MTNKDKVSSCTGLLINNFKSKDMRLKRLNNTKLIKNPRLNKINTTIVEKFYSLKNGKLIKRTKKLYYRP